MSTTPLDIHTVLVEAASDRTDLLAEAVDTASEIDIGAAIFHEKLLHRRTRVESARIRRPHRQATRLDALLRELRRDDAAGQSEMQAWAWDQENNVRSTRSFIVPHERMARKERQKLTDLGDQG